MKADEDSRKKRLALLLAFFTADWQKSGRHHNKPAVAET
jgi:hypothetical protein